MARSIGSAASAVLVGAVSLALFAGPAFAGDRFTVCSITINSDDEIKTFRKHLPKSHFDFVELTELAGAVTIEGQSPDSSWFRRACATGISCDVLVVSGHFGNTYAGSYGTTFQGESGLAVSLEDFEERSCSESCPGIMADPLEVFLFGCRTLGKSLADEPLPAGDLQLLAQHQIPANVAEEMVDEVRYQGEGTNNRTRMRSAFARVPRLYGFFEVGPIGPAVAPHLETYFKNRGSYAKHLAELRSGRGRGDDAPPNRPLERALQSGTFAQVGGLRPNEPEYDRRTRECFLVNERNSLLARLEHVNGLVEEPGFVTYLRAIESLFEEHDPVAFGDAERASFERIRNNESAREVVNGLVRRLRNPTLRLEILRVGRSLGWIGEDEGLKLRRELVLDLLRPPVYGEGRDLICGMETDVLKRIEIHAGDIPAEVYEDEFGIQALGCLKPADESIHERLGQSLSDSREWIALLSAAALKNIKPARVEVQLAIVQQLTHPKDAPRKSAAAVLRELKPSDPRVLDAIRKNDPSFSIDWL